MTRIDRIEQDRKLYITLQEAADILGVSTRTVRAMIADGRLRGYRLGPRVVRLRLAEVESALQPMGV